MNDIPTTTEREPDFGHDGAKSVAQNVRIKAHENYESCEQKVRQSPGKAVLIAIGAGFCLNRLPVASLLALPVRLTCVLAKPALLILGATKLYEIVGKPSRKYE